MEDKKTVFNSSIESLKRLNELLSRANIYSEQAATHTNLRYLSLWHRTLISIHKEIFPKLSKEEKTKLRKMFEAFKKIKSLIKVKHPQPGVKITVINITEFNQTTSVCDKVDFALRVLATKHGMLITDEHGMGEEMDDD